MTDFLPEPKTSNAFATLEILIALKLIQLKDVSVVLSAPEHPGTYGTWASESHMVGRA